MTQILIRIYQILRVFGFDPIQFFKSLIGIPLFLRDLMTLTFQKGADRSFKFGLLYPILSDRFSESGIMSGHYFHQDLYVARRIFENNPRKILDIGSRTDGFVAHIAVFREIDVIDIRDQTSKVKNINFKKADLMQLPRNLISSYDSVSSLHAIEHFGLGRYGDPVNYLGHLEAFQNIYKILKKGGVFYFSSPIGPQRIEFNSMRVFSLKYLLDLFKDKYILQRFSYVDDKGNFYENIKISENDLDSNFGCIYGCGIFELIKK